MARRHRLAWNHQSRRRTERVRPLHLDRRNQVFRQAIIRSKVVA
jgi:hypothetical protein